MKRINLDVLGHWQISEVFVSLTVYLLGMLYEKEVL